MALPIDADSASSAAGALTFPQPVKATVHLNCKQTAAKTTAIAKMRGFFAALRMTSSFFGVNDLRRE